MRWFVLVVGCLYGAFVVRTPCSASEPLPAERLLSDFINDDGTTPDGRESQRDDSSALRKAMNAGPGIVRIGPGTYRIHVVTIPEGVTVIGAGPATILQAFDSRPVFVQRNVRAWRLRDVTIQGEAVGPWTQRRDYGAYGLVIDRCSSYEVSGIGIKNFDGVGLQILRTNLGAAGFSDGGTLSRIVAAENFIGVRFDTRAEYITASQLDCNHNITGLAIHAGNTNIATSNIGDNYDGIVIDDHENGSHGSLTGCLANHNRRYALLARNAGNGMAISNCCFFYGTIRLENSRGVNITSGLISTAISTEGPDFNRIAGNHIIPQTFQFKFAPSTLVEGNFTKDGPWEHNRP